MTTSASLSRSRTRRRLGSTVLLVGLLVAGSACSAGRADVAALPGGGAAELRLGYFANVTHAGAVHGVATGRFQQALGRTKLSTSVFNAGPAAMEALRGGGIDAAFVGPNPALNGFAQTDGELLRIVAGTTSGGASLVGRAGITGVEQLAGKKVATPQLGNTQDVAAKAYFADRGLDVTIVNQENAQTLDLLKAGRIDGGWVPEPWASRLVLEGGGTVLLDERSLWPRGQFVTTHLVVRRDFLAEHPSTVRLLLEALVTSTDAVATKSPDVQAVVNQQILEDTGKALRPEVLAAAFATLTPTTDPVASSLVRSARDAQAAGLLKPVDLRGIYDLSLLNAVLAAVGRPAVTDAGLGAGPTSGPPTVPPTAVATPTATAAATP